MKEYKVGNQTAVVHNGWLQNIKDFRFQIWTNDEQWSMSDIGTASEIAKEWERRFEGTVGILNNCILMFGQDGKEISKIGGFACVARYNAGEKTIDVEVVYI